MRFWARNLGRIMAKNDDLIPETFDINFLVCTLYFKIVYRTL